MRGKKALPLQPQTQTGPPVKAPRGGKFGDAEEREIVEMMPLRIERAAPGRRGPGPVWEAGPRPDEGTRKKEG